MKSNKKEQVHFADWVAVVSPAGTEELVEYFGRIRSLAGLRAVVVDCTGEYSTNEVELDLSEIVGSIMVPVISAIGGDARGWVSALAGASHICFADKDAVFYFEPLAPPVPRDQAEREGLINKLPEQETAIGMAVKAAEKIASMAPLAVMACLESVENSFVQDFADGLEKEAKLFAELFETQDMKRGTEAFFAKKRPAFEGN